MFIIVICIRIHHHCTSNIFSNITSQFKCLYIGKWISFSLLRFHRSMHLKMFVIILAIDTLNVIITILIWVSTKFCVHSGKRLKIVVLFHEMKVIWNWIGYSSCLTECVRVCVSHSANLFPFPNFHLNFWLISFENFASPRVYYGRFFRDIIFHKMIIIKKKLYNKFRS